MIVAHARSAHAAKRRILQRRMHDHIIDGDTAGQRVVQHPVLLRLVAAEVVQGQRALTGIDRGHGVADVQEAAQHHGRAKDFVLRDFGFGWRVDDQRQRQAAVCAGLRGADFQHGQTARLGIIDIGFHTCVVALVDHGRHVCVACHRGIQRLILRGNAIGQRLQAGFMDPDHVG